MAFFIDIVFVMILVVCVWTGYKKGIIMGVGGILVFIVSVYGADLVSNTFSYEVIPALRPFVSGYMEAQMKASIYKELGIEIPDQDEESEAAQFGEGVIEDERALLSMDDLIDQNPGILHRVYTGSIRNIGIPYATAELIAKEAEDYYDENDVSRLVALTTVVCRRLTYAMGFLLAFVLIIIVLTMIGNITNLSFKIPGLDMVNDIGGAVFGVVTGFLFCSMVAWMLKFTGLAISEETLASTVIAEWFMKRDIIAGFIGI